jgi:hypothetical protein
MDDKNDIQEPADSFGSVMTKAEDKIVTDARTTQINKYKNDI